MLSCLLEEMKHAKEYKLYYSAIAMACMIPDICGKLQYTSGNAKEKYIQWFNEWVHKYFETPHLESEDEMYNKYDCCSDFNGEVCYKLRCAYLHSGNSELQLNPKSLTITFCMNEGELHYGDKSGCMFCNDEYVSANRCFNIVTFLDGFIQGLETYLEEHGDTNKNIPFEIISVEAQNHTFE